MNMNGLAMARYESRLRQDVATGHMTLLEAYSALYNPILDQKASNNVKKNTKNKKNVKQIQQKH